MSAVPGGAPALQPQTSGTLPLERVLRRLIVWCMLPLVAVMAVLSVQSVRTTRAEMDASAERLVNRVAASVDQMLHARIAALRVIAGGPRITEATGRRDAYDQALVYRRVFGGDVVLAGPSGDMMFNTRVPYGTGLPPLPRPAGHAAAAIAFDSGKVAVGDAFMGPIAKVPLVAIAVPVPRPEPGPPDLVLLSPTECRVFEQALGEPPLPPGWSIALRDGRNEAIAARAWPPASSATGTVADAGTGKRFVVASQLSAWSVELMISPEQYRAPVWDAAQPLVLTLVAATLASLIGAGFGSRRLARSVATLVEPPSPGEVPTRIAEIVAVRERLDESGRGRDAALRALRDSQATFQLLFDAMLDAIVYTDAERRIRMVNPAFEGLFGYAASDVIGRSSEMLYADPVDFVRSGQLLFHARARGAGTYEMRYRHRDGGQFDAETSGVRITGPDGEATGFVGVHRDISQRRRSDQLNRELHERFSQVFRTSPLGIAIGRMLDGRLIDSNPALQSMLGYERDELMGKTGPELGLWVDPQARDVVMHAMDAAGVIRHIETQFRCKSGQLLEVSYSGCRIEIAGVAHFVGMISDITSAQRARRELQTQQVRLEVLVAQRTAALEAANRELEASAHFNRTITDNLPGRVTYWDAQQRCRFANRPYLEWVGRPLEAVLGRTMAEAVAPSHYEDVRAHVLAALAGEVRQFERETRRSEGVFVHRIHYIPDRVGEGPVRGFYVLAMDITAYARAQAELAVSNAALSRALFKAEDATRAKSAFLANMSHEIRTPMNAIIGLTYLMTRETHDAQQRERLAKVDGAAKHLLQIINDILDLSKIEAGKMTLEDADFAVDDLTSRTLDMIGAAARDKGLELVLDTDHLPSRLRGDSQRLSQSLLNLLSNAVKFTDRGWIRLSAQLLGDDGRRVQVRFEVQDTGRGIAADQQDTLFDAFEQADSSTTRRHGGTGLGLALTRHFATMMGGTTGVDSALGSGSTFWFTAWLGHAADAGEPASAIPLEGMRALLVDDLAPSLEAVGDGLQRFGMTVDAVSSGATALDRVGAALADGRSYDVLLIDWRMEPMDGIETLARLRQRLGDATPPSVLVTAFNETSMWQQSRDAGFDAVLVKPVTPSTLHDTLMRVLRAQAPVQLAAAVAGTEAAGALRRHHAGQRVLLVEDNPINLEVAVELLGSVGLLVETAENGAVALDRVTSRDYELVLMDVQMPVMDGLSATRAIRTRLGSALPIVAMTANAFGEDRDACLRSGMNDHVAKPVDPVALYTTLLRWLPSRRGPAPAHAARVAQAAVPADRARASLVQRLGQVEGFDVLAALRNVGGQEAILERLVSRFVRTYRHGVPELANPPDDNARSLWLAACHSLRGACATLGASMLPPQLEAFERELRGAPDVAALAQTARAVNDQLCRLVARLARQVDD